MKNNSLTLFKTELNEIIFTTANYEFKKYRNLYQDFMESSKTIDDIINLFINTIYEQFFNNGNKRSATLMLNFWLIKGDYGVFILNEQTAKTFRTILKDFYNDKQANEVNLKQFIKNNIKKYLKQKHKLNIK